MNLGRHDEAPERDYGLLDVGANVLRFRAPSNLFQRWNESPITRSACHPNSGESSISHTVGGWNLCWRAP